MSESAEFPPSKDTLVTIEDTLRALRSIRHAVLQVPQEQQTIFFQDAETVATLGAQSAIDTWVQNTSPDPAAPELIKTIMNKYKDFPPLFTGNISRGGTIRQLRESLVAIREFEDMYLFFENSVHSRHPGLRENILNQPTTTIVAPLSTDFLYAKAYQLMAEQVTRQTFPPVVPAAISEDRKTVILPETGPLSQSETFVIFTDTNATGETLTSTAKEIKAKFPNKFLYHEQL